jgi:signal transduction histidine kinase
LQLTRQGINTLEAFLFAENNLPVAIIATPVVQGEQVTGLTLAWAALPSLWNYLLDIRVGQTGYLYLVDQNGQVVASPGAGRPAPPALLSPPSSGATYQGLSGEPVMGKSAAIENTPWRLVIEIPVAEANRSLRSLLIILAAILLFAISLAIWVARLFSRWLLQPIYTLHQSATRISAGDLAHRINLDRQDELGFLAAAFNQMVAALEQTIRELRAVSLHLLSAQELERRRIAQEIHDELGQMLTALRLNLWLSMQSDPQNQTLIAAHHQATQVQEKARHLSHELRPAMLDDLGLLPTLEWYIDRVEQRANLAIVMEAQFDEASLSPTIKTALYRLIAEALTNITKHAQASVVEINLRQNEHTLELTITDDGRGFEPAVLNHSQTLGIAGMRERVNLLQGQFCLESQPGAGAKIAVSLPLQS